MSKGKKIELLGMVLVLVATAFQLFFVNTLIGIESNSAYYEIHNKLNTIWYVLSDYYSHTSQNKSGAMVAADFKHAIESWKVYQYGYKHLLEQRKFASSIFGLIFVAGSGLIIFGKYQDAKIN